MISVSVGEAKNRLPYYLHLVEEKGEQIQITRHGKTVAYLNNQESTGVIDKRNLFAEGLIKWRAKWADELAQTTNEEIDAIFAREKDIEPYIRHPEDFE